MAEKAGFLRDIKLFCYGIIMGGADVIPGVSGGTMAFILGIYEELLEVIRAWSSPQALRLIFTFHWIKAFQTLPWRFPLALFAGIGGAIVSLASPIKYLLEHHPALLWAFFFGLVLASILVVIRRVKRWSAGVWVSMFLGALVAWIIVGLVPTETTTALWFIVFCGALAICAMILPGISGSFILLLLGKYDYVLGAVHNLKTALLSGNWAEVLPNVVILVCFVIGIVIGLSSFVRGLQFLFRKYHDLTVAALIGFMAGSLRKVWPFKTPEEVNMLPDRFDGLVWGAIGLAVFGFLLVILLETLSAKKENK